MKEKANRQECIMRIINANYQDLQEILNLQHLRILSLVALFLGIILLPLWVLAMFVTNM
jgi:hypothetical protein